MLPFAVRTRTRRSLLVAALVAAPVLAASPCARATERTARRGARLTWARGVGAERCVGQLGLEEDVKARLAYDPFALAPDRTIEGLVVAAGKGGLRAEWRVRDGEGRELGSRTLVARGPDCASLGEAVAVALALTIDPDADVDRATASDASPDPPMGSRAPPPRPAPPRLAALRGRASLAATAQAGVVPGVAPGVTLRVLFALSPRVELGAGASYVAEQARDGVGFALTTLSLDGCATPFDALRSLRACAAVRGGALHVAVRAPELAPLAVGAAPWLALEAGPTLAVPLGTRVALEARAAATVPVTRRQALVRGAPGALWEQATVGAVAELGAAIVF